MYCTYIYDLKTLAPGVLLFYANLSTFSCLVTTESTEHVILYDVAYDKQFVVKQHRTYRGAIWEITAIPSVFWFNS